MQDHFIFDIPIYRKTKDDFCKEVETYVAMQIESIKSYDPENRPLDHEVHQRVYHRVVAESGGPWQFNQVVGWLRLFVKGNTIG